MLSLGIFSGWWQSKRVEKLEEEGKQLEAEAKRLGLSGWAGGGAEQRVTKIQRPGKEKKLQAVESLLAELIEFGFEDGQAGAGGLKHDERGLELSARIAALDAAGIRGLVEALAGNEEISDEARSHIVGFAISVYASDHPAAAAAMLIEHQGLMKDRWMRTLAVSTTLRHWGEVDPDAAARWLGSQSQDHPEIAGDDAKRALLSGIAKDDPARAFGMLDGLRMDDADGAVQEILEAGLGDPGKRDGFFAALRAHAATMDDEVRREELLDEGFGGLAQSVKTGDFDSLSSWMEEAALTQDEKRRFAQGLGYFNTRQDTGRWVEWMSSELPPGELSAPVSMLVGEWTQQDYRAAGEWLAGLAETPARAPAVEAYAEAVAEYEPAVAEQWALTLAPGEARESTLRAIHMNWPAADPDGARAFAERHGID